MLRARLDADKALRQMAAIAGRHAPFAFVKSLTNLAQMGRDAARKRTEAEFDLKSGFIPRGITIQPAKLSQMKSTGHADAYVLTKPIISEWMPAHEYGAVKRPGSYGGKGDKGRMLAIPSRWLRKQNYQLRSGKVRAKWRPSKLLEGYNSISPRDAARQRGQRKRFGPRTPFITTLDGGVRAIVRRASPVGAKQPYPLQVLWILVPEARIPERWRFHPAVEEVVAANFGQVFARNIRHALATAR
jgi:hypothetical protein